MGPEAVNDGWQRQREMAQGTIPTPFLELELEGAVFQALSTGEFLLLSLSEGSTMMNLMLAKSVVFDRCPASSGISLMRPRDSLSGRPSIRFQFPSRVAWC